MDRPLELKLAACFANVGYLLHLQSLVANIAVALMDRRPILHFIEELPMYQVGLNNMLGNLLHKGKVLIVPLMKDGGDTDNIGTMHSSS